MAMIHARKVGHNYPRRLPDISSMIKTCASWSSACGKLELETREKQFQISDRRSGMAGAVMPQETTMTLLGD